MLVAVFAPLISIIITFSDCKAMAAYNHAFLIVGGFPCRKEVSSFQKRCHLYCWWKHPQQHKGLRIFRYLDYKTRQSSVNSVLQWIRCMICEKAHANVVQPLDWYFSSQKNKKKKDLSGMNICSCGNSFSCMTAGCVPTSHHNSSHFLQTNRRFPPSLSAFQQTHQSKRCVFSLQRLYHLTLSVCVTKIKHVFLIVKLYSNHGFWLHWLPFVQPQFYYKYHGVWLSNLELPY